MTPSNKKKIAFVVGALTAGGAERVVSTLANAMSTKNDVTIITFRKTKAFYRLNEKVSVVSCLEEIEPSKSILDSLKLNYKLYKRLCSLLQQNNIQIVIGFITMANIMTVLAAKRLSMPCIISERNNPETDSTPIFWRLLRRLTYPLANALIVQTEPIRDFYRNIVNPTKISIIVNPISPNLSKKRAENHNKKNIVLNVGRLHKQKNQKMLIRAFAGLNYPDWTLYIIGEGDERNRLENFISELGIQNNVMLLGKKENIHEFYNNAKIFAFSSDYEGFPNALIEAMHFGLPCVSTDCPTGPSKIIADGENGFLVPVNDQTKFQAQLQQLIQDSKLREKFSNKSIKVTEKFEVQRITAMWESVINAHLSAK